MPAPWRVIWPRLRRKGTSVNENLTDEQRMAIARVFAVNNSGHDSREVYGVESCDELMMLDLGVIADLYFARDTNVKRLVLREKHGNRDLVYTEVLGFHDEADPLA